jgi:hypothetical protein
MLKWWQWVLVGVVTAVAVVFAIESWSPNGMIDDYRARQLMERLQQDAASESVRLAEQEAARERARAAAEARRLRNEQDPAMNPPPRN